MALKLSDEQAKALGIAEHIPPKVTRAKVDPDGMNKTERIYADRLDVQVRAGHICGYWFELLKFRLADRCWYRPDFLIEQLDRTMVIHEVKGGWIREDGWLKLKFAAETIPFPFFLAQYTGGAWSVTRIAGRGLVH